MEISVNTVEIFIIAVFFVLGILDKAFLKGRFGLAKELESGVAQIGGLVFSLIGIMCFAPLLGKLLSPVLGPVYNLIGADPANFAVIGIIMSIANAMPVYGMVNNMDKRGKLYCIAFSAPACYMLGAHLAFTATYIPSAILPMILSKVIGGIFAILIVWFVFARKDKSLKGTIAYDDWYASPDKKDDKAEAAE